MPLAYPQSVIPQINAIRRFERWGWPTHSINLSLMAMGYEVDWEKLRWSLAAWVGAVDGLLDRLIDQQGSLREDWVWRAREELLSAPRPRRGRPSTQDAIDRRQRIEQQLANAVAVASVLAPALRGLAAARLPPDLMHKIDPSLDQLHRSLTGGPPRWLTWDHWTSRVHAADKETWVAVQAVFRLLATRYLRPMASANGLPHNVRRVVGLLALRPDVVPLYTIPMLDDAWRQTVHGFLSDESTHSRFVEGLRHMTEGR